LLTTPLTPHTPSKADSDRGNRRHESKERKEKKHKHKKDKHKKDKKHRRRSSSADNDARLAEAKAFLQQVRLWWLWRHHVGFEVVGGGWRFAAESRSKPQLIQPQHPPTPTQVLQQGGGGQAAAVAAAAVLAAEQAAAGSSRGADGSGGSSKHEEKRQRKRQERLPKPKPAGVVDITKDDYFAKSAEFTAWLSEVRGQLFNTLTSEETHALFGEFVEDWNQGHVSAGWGAGLGRGWADHGGC
jgi:hypothetical protein